MENTQCKPKYCKNTKFDMILGSKEWTNDYGACLSGDDNDLKTKSRLILQS